MTGPDRDKSFESSPGHRNGDHNANAFGLPPATRHRLLEGKPPAQDASGTGKKHLPQFELVAYEKPRVKALIDDRDEEEAKEKLAKLVDEQSRKRRDDRYKADNARRDTSYAAERKQWNEKKTIEGKYKVGPYLANSDTHDRWLRDRLPLLIYYNYNEDRRRAVARGGDEAGEIIDRDRGKQWQEFCKLAGIDKDEGHQARVLASMAVSSGGGRFRAWAERDGRTRASNIQGTDTNDGRRTWEELCARLLRDVSAPGSANRDLSAFCLRDALTSNPAGLLEGSWPPLLDGLNLLTKADKNDAPLSSSDRAFTLRQVLKDLAEPRYINPKDVSPSFQLAVISQLSELGDLQSLPIYKKLAKNSPFPDVRAAASRAASDLGPLPSQLWQDTVPDPRLTPESRAERVRKQLDTKYLSYGELDNGQSVVEEIASAYRFPKGQSAIEGKDDPGLKQLERALGSEYVSVRLMAAMVISMSKFDAAEPIRKKADETFLDAILDNNVGMKMTREAMALLDRSLGARREVALPAYALKKENGVLFAENKNGRYAWTEDGKIERLDKDGGIIDGDTAANVTLSKDTIVCKYGANCIIKSRTAKLDGDALKEMRWTVSDGAGEREFVARRHQVEGRYVDKWTITVPDPVSKLTKDIDVSGKFELTKAGDFTYVGDNWTSFGLGQTLYQSQKLRGKGVRQYTE
jgi:hypothetical protein